MPTRSTGPDIVIVGAARCGTSYLSATLGTHPLVDQGAVKEPNYFSSQWAQGAEWYESLYASRTPGIFRLDSSVSYTYPQHPRALERLSQVSPHAKLIYGVRDPIRRLVSHYQLFRYYARSDDRTTLGEAIDRSEMIVGTSDYEHWLNHMGRYFPPDQLMVVPFPLMTGDIRTTLDTVLPWLGLPFQESMANGDAEIYRNEVRQFRSRHVQRIHAHLNRSRVYPRLRSMVGADRLRRLRRVVTKPMAVPAVEVELASLTDAQREHANSLSEAACRAVAAHLKDQDTRYGVDWLSVWMAHVSRQG